MSSLIGKRIGVNFRKSDTTGKHISVERCYGIIEAIESDGLAVELKGARLGEKITVPLDINQVSLNGDFYFPDSNEWVHFDYFIEIRVQPSN